MCDFFKFLKKLSVANPKKSFEIFDDHESPSNLMKTHDALKNLKKKSKARIPPQN